MRLSTLLRRRVNSHPVAFAAVVLSVIMSMVVLVSLQLLIAHISDSSVRRVLDAPVADRSIAVRGSVQPADSAPADRSIREVLTQAARSTTVTRVGLPISLGIQGRPGTDRAQLADVDGVQDAARLIEGAWPSSSAHERVEVALPDPAMRAAGVSLGDVVTLTDLTDATARPLSVTVVGRFGVLDKTDPLWVDLPLAVSGVEQGDFRTFGPFVLAPGSLERDPRIARVASTVWRATPDLSGSTADTLARDRAQVARVLAQVSAVVGADVPSDVGAAKAPAGLAVQVRNASINTDLPDLFTQARTVADRLRAALLTPAVLLVLLGTVALIVSSGLLATLRESDTRLLRTRGASTGQLAVMSGVEAALIMVVGTLTSIVVAPWLVLLVSRVGGFTSPHASFLDAAATPSIWLTLSAMALAWTVAIVATTLRLAGSRDQDRGERSVGRGLAVLSGSGLDLMLVALGGLAAYQLRRYDASGSGAVDPLTIAAPACVVAGLCVVALRLLPIVTRWVAKLTAGSSGLSVTWGGWQLSRRLAGQSGTILLILLGVGMADVALSYGATADRAFADQVRAEVGAPVRVSQAYVRGNEAFAGSVYERAVGSRDQVMPVLRSSQDLGSLTGVDVLAIDATTAGRVMHPRADTLGDHTWGELVGTLARGRVLAPGIDLPGRPSKISLTASLPLLPPALVERGPSTSFASQPVGSLLVRDGRGLLASLPFGDLGFADQRYDVALPTLGPQVTYPLTLVAISVQLPAAYQYANFDKDALELKVADLTVDGKGVTALNQLQPQRVGLDLQLSVAVDRAYRPPAIITDEVARATKVHPGDDMRLPVGGREVMVKVAAVVTSLPTANYPNRGVLVDLASIQEARDAAREGGGRPITVLPPQEWWLAPDRPMAASAAVAADGFVVASVAQESSALQQRRTDDVNVGMRSAMALVAAASLLLAAVGFAATTAALGRTRRRENAVLVALGMPPRSVRKTLVLERVAVVAAAVIVGTIVGAITTAAVVPLLVGGDGVAQVPPVLLVLPWHMLAVLAVSVWLLLCLVSAMVLKRSTADLAEELRRGEG